MIIAAAVYLQQNKFCHLNVTFKIVHAQKKLIETIFIILAKTTVT